MTWVPDQFRFSGGLNEEDPAFTLPAGMLTFCRNYEVLAGGGYRRVSGYERFDGSVATPSGATYEYLPYQNGGPRQVVSGDVLVGATSGATAVAVGTTELASGGWNTEDAAGNIGITARSGTFLQGETITTLDIYACVAAESEQTSSVADASFKSWLGGARDYYRSLIGQPAGGGQILGGFVLDGDVYCFRNDDPDNPTAAVMFKATTGGWSAVVLNQTLNYNTLASDSLVEGVTITGGTSGATAIVRRINVAGGNITGPTYATGSLAITDVTGTFMDGEDIEVSSIAVAVTVGTQTDTTFLPSGEFHTVVHNFYGASNFRRVYGVDGVNPGWEYDGTYFNWNRTLMPVDAPQRVEAHVNSLFFAFPGGSLQYSSTGLPTEWSVRLGAGELSIGDDITNLMSNGHNTLAVTAKQTLSVLQGTGPADWILDALSDEIGSVANTMQEAGGNTIFLDRASINIMIPAPLSYQDVQTQAISRNVRAMVEEKAAHAVTSVRNLVKNQYRIYFDDKNALTATYYGSKLMGFAECQYAHQFVTTFRGQDASGADQLYGGTDDGYVMLMDTGSSFDGQNIESILQFPYGYHKSPDRDKRFHKITLECNTPKAIDLRIVLDFDYGNGGQSGQFSKTTNPTGGLWDVSRWDQFFWDSAVLSAPEVNIDGVGKNIGITIYHNDAVDDSFSLSAALLQYTVLGIKR